MGSMKMGSMKIRSMILAAAVSLGAGSLSKASTMYSYVVQPQGGAIVDNANNTLNLYLQEVTSGGSFTAASDGGLYAGGVALVEQAGGSGVTFTASGVSNNGAAEPSGFTGNNKAGVFTSGGAWVTDITNNADTTAGVAPVSSSTSGGTTTSLYLLGSVTVGVGATPNASFKVESLHDSPTNDGAPAAGADGNTLSFNSGNDLDAGGFSAGVVGADGHPTSFAISSASPVPEPASLAVFGVGAMGLLMRRRRTAGVSARLQSIQFTPIARANRRNVSR